MPEVWKVVVINTIEKVMERESRTYPYKVEDMVQGIGNSLSEALMDLGKNRNLPYEPKIYPARPSIAGVARWGA